jgi:hypothetical protein
MAIATLFTELDLDMSKFQAKQKKLLDDIKKVGADSETALQRSFMNLGVTSDSVYKLMVEKARVSYEQIVQSGKASAAEQVRAQQAMVSQINAINAKMNAGADAHYATLGMKSADDVKQRISAVQNAATAQQAIVGKSSEDWIRIERAKNEKLKELNKEMTGQHEMSMASMTRAVLRFYAAYYVLSAAVSSISSLFVGGVKAIDDMQFSAISIASTITSMQGTSGNVTENYKKNLEYAKGLVPVLQQVDAASYANLQEIMVINTQLALHGVYLDANKAKQVESFTALTNAVKIFTNGQDMMKQSGQEIRAMFTGIIRPGDMVAMQMDSLIKNEGKYAGGLKEVVKLGQQHGDTLERFLPYLQGIVAGVGDIQKTWAAVSSSMETSWNILQRGLFADFYKSLTESGKAANEWLKKNTDDLVETIRNIATGLKYATESTLLLLGAFALVKASIYIWTTLYAIVSSGTVIITLQIAALNAWTYVTGGPAVWAVNSLGAAMKAAFGVFTAFFVGWEIGKFLNKFETIRRAGIAMVYGIMNAWAWFTEKLEVGWERMKLAGMSEDLSAKDYAQADKDTQHNIELIRKRYAAEKTIRDQYGVEQWNEQSDAGIAAAKKKSKATTSPPPPPHNGNFTDDAKKAAEDAKKLAEQWKETSRTLAEKIEMDGLTGIRKEFQRNLNDAEKLKEQYAKLPPALREVAYAEIDAAKASADAAVIDKAKIASAEEYTKVKIKEAEELRKLEAEKSAAAEEYRRIMLSVDDFSTDRQIQSMNRILTAEKEKYKRIDELAELSGKTAAEVEKDKAKILEDANRQRIKMSSEAFYKENEDRQQAFSSMAQNFSAMAQLYDEGSKQRQLLSEASKAATIAEIALQVQKNLMIAVGAVVNQGTGDPYTAFARIAAMVAVVSGVLSIAGIAFGSGGSGSASIAPSLPASTVLGAEAGTGSESISKSWELLQDTYEMEYRELSGIYSEMKNLNDNITGLVTGYIRTGGVSGFNIATGKTIGSAEKLYQSSYADFSNKLLMNDPLSKWVTNTLGKVIGSIFGGGTTTSITASGISTGEASIADLLGGGGIGASSYADIKKKTDGGWFSSDKTRYYTMYQSLDSNVSDLLDKVFQNMGSTMINLTTAFGTDMNSTLNYVFSGAKINLQGMDSDAINETLSEYFSNIGDTAVEALFGSIVSQYQEVGEGLMETASRLLIDKGAISYWIDKMNQSFQGTIPEAIKFSETLITIAGSLEDLTDAMQSYYDKFFSDSEKQAKLKQELIGEFSAIGYGLPSDRADYRALVESLNLATDAGQAAYVALMQMSEGADQYYSYLEDAKDAVKSNIKPENYSTNLEYQRALAMIPAYADGGSFGGGYRIVGENGPEIEYTAPSMIYSNKNSKSLVNNDELIAEIRALREELGAGNYQIAANTQKSAKFLQYLEQWDDDGLPPVRN